MSTIVGDTVCPRCRENGGDSTGNHLMIFSDGGKYCNRCQYKEGKTIDKANEDTVDKEIYTNMLLKSMAQVNALSSNAIEDRCLLESTVSLHKIKTQHDTSSGNIIAHYYPRYINGIHTNYKRRVLPKKLKLLLPEGQGKKLDWMYQHVSPKGGKKLLICGGDLDAPSAYQMIKSSKYKGMSMACVSPPNGENISSLTDNALEYAKSFETIISFADQDAAGDKFSKALSDLFGVDNVLVAKMSENDVSDMLTKNKQDEFINAIFKAEKYKPKSLITVSDVWEDAIKIPEYGKPFPWPSLTQLTYGRRLGDGYYIGAGKHLCSL